MTPNIYSDLGNPNVFGHPEIAPLLLQSLRKLAMPQETPYQPTFGPPASGNDTSMNPPQFTNLATSAQAPTADPADYNTLMQSIVDQDAALRTKGAGMTMPVQHDGLPRPGLAGIGLALGLALNSLPGSHGAGGQLAQGIMSNTAQQAQTQYTNDVNNYKMGQAGIGASLANNQEKFGLLSHQQGRADVQAQQDRTYSLEKSRLDEQMKKDDAADVDRFLSRLGGYKKPEDLRRQLTAFEIARKSQNKPLPEGWDAIKQSLVDHATQQYQKDQLVGQYTKAAAGLQKKYADVTNQGATKIPASYRVGKANEIVKELSSYLIPNENGDPEIIQHNARIQAQIDGVNGMLPDLAKTTDAEKLLTSQLGISQSKATLLADQVKNFDADHAKKMALLVAQTDHYKTQADQWAQKFAQSNQQFAYKQYFSSLAAQTPLINHQKDLITHQLEVLNKQIAAAGGTPNEAQTNQIQALNEQYGKLDSQAQLNENEMGRYQQYQVQQASNAGQAMQGRLPQGPSQSGPPIGGTITPNGTVPGGGFKPFDPTGGGASITPVGPTTPGGAVGNSLGGVLGTSNPTPKKQAKGAQKTKSGVSFTFK